MGSVKIVGGGSSSGSTDVSGAVMIKHGGSTGAAVELRGSTRALAVEIVNSSGSQVNTFGSTNTEKTNGAVFGPTGLGNMIIGVRKDTATALSGVADGDYTAFQTDATGRLRVRSELIETLLTSLPTVYGEPYCSPQNFTATYATASTLAITGAPFTLDDATCYIAIVAVNNVSHVWTKYVNGHNGISLYWSATGTLTILQNGVALSAFAATDIAYRVVILQEEKGYDVSTDTDKVTEQAPLNNKYVADSIVDTTNQATGLAYFPSAAGMSHDGFRDLSLTGQFVDADGTITAWLEVTNDEAAATGDFRKIYGADDMNGVAINQISVTNSTLNFALNYENLNYSFVRVAVYPTSATNTIIVKMRRKAI